MHIQASFMQYPCSTKFWSAVWAFGVEFLNVLDNYVSILFLSRDNFLFLIVSRSMCPICITSCCLSFVRFERFP